MRSSAHCIAPCNIRHANLLRLAILICVAGTTALLLLMPRQQTDTSTLSEMAAVSRAPPGLNWKLVANLASISNNADNETIESEFGHAYAELRQQQHSGYLYEFDPHLKLPVLRLSSLSESDAAYRVRVASVWLKSSVHLVFAATVRNAMRGLPSTVEQMKRLAERFNQTSFVFVENDSTDETRKFLIDWRRRDPRVSVLGCGGSESACRINVSYSTGRAHSPGWAYQRNGAENLERGVLMSALRNIYLTFIYKQLTMANSLLIVVDADLTFKPWNLDSIVQGLYYFKHRAQLHSLCAHTRYRNNDVYDTCTLQFYSNRHFSQADESKIIANIRQQAATGPPPVKVDSCFQAFTAYRLPHLAQQQVMYGPAAGETVCEHNTLARQLKENYLDLNMRLDVLKQNEGGI